jgi:hypothetical protein
MVRNFAYRHYLKLNTAVGAAVGASLANHKEHSLSTDRSEAKLVLSPLAEMEFTRLGIKQDDTVAVDKLATELGNSYRGAGVIIGALAVGIIFCGVTPSALALTSSQAMIIGITEIALMIATLFIIFFNRQTKEKWIAIRGQAEHLRYLPLKQASDLLVTTPLLQNATALKTDLTKVVIEQKNWNKAKAIQYHAIEHFAQSFTWVGFLVALIFSLLHFVFHQNWFSYFTIGLPVSIGALHATNGFLKIEDLKDSYLKMHTKLSDLLNQIETCDFSDTQTQSSAMFHLSQLAEETRAALTNQDRKWSYTASKIGLRPS